ncbi:hypothetical protein TL16_g05324 [Triparma laevis f. inornata]|uniref:Kinesin light chain n=1 Tax=Triparma laevis f. inornata TaxID=1714386 RepID=A0A9W7ACD3_9STRA|nr:hypothetical protein TL16_g05324 [Triparma laevis f. inornata]
MARQVLMITKSEDLVKLRALAKLCSQDFFDDPSLLVVAWRKILEVLVFAMLPVVDEKKARGEKKQKKKKKKDPRKLEILDACFELGKACQWVRDFDDAIRYLKRAKEGYEKQLGRDSEKALEATYLLVLSTQMINDKKVEKLRDLLKRMERALGEENVVTLEMLNPLGGRLRTNGEYQEAKEVWERCSAGQMKVLGEDHKDTLASLNNLGVVYKVLGNYEKALEYYEGYERMLGKTHPQTLGSVVNIALVFKAQKDYGNAEELYQKSLEGYEAQLGKDHRLTKQCANNLKLCCKLSGNT